MANSREKEAILKQAGYKYHFERSLYFNREKHKIFSTEAIDDHSVEWLKQKMAEPNPSGDWSLYFNTPPSEATQTAVFEIFK